MIPIQGVVFSWLRWMLWIRCDVWRIFDLIRIEIWPWNGKNLKKNHIIFDFEIYSAFQISLCVVVIFPEWSLAREAGLGPNPCWHAVRYDCMVMQLLRKSCAKVILCWMLFCQHWSRLQPCGRQIRCNVFQFQSCGQDVCLTVSHHQIAHL